MICFCVWMFSLSSRMEYNPTIFLKSELRDLRRVWENGWEGIVGHGDVCIGELCLLVMV